MTTSVLHPWRPLAGRALEWAAVRVKRQVVVMVRKRGAETGPALVYPASTIPTESHALEVLEAHKSELTRTRG